MGQKLHNRIETWKKLLLDFGKRNRLINFRESKRSNVKILVPSYAEIYERIAVREENMAFPYFKKPIIDDEGEERSECIINGDFETSKTVTELQKTLKALRYRAKTSIEEQGINILFLTFGMLKWRERDDSTEFFSSPIVLVPVILKIESLTSPYVLSLHEDEIVVNPTLRYKLENDFGIQLPEFDGTQDSISDYLEKCETIVVKKGWAIERSVHLTILSFLKINMYKDLERNEERLGAHPIISAIVGENDALAVSDDLNDYDHDKNERPINVFQVVDADASQQDAILLSKKGASFVLQGPPGTGKSQTITNIISEALADGKKVLFVSEKMAALQVVFNRLSSVGLADFCLSLHSHKANKKEILRELANSISVDRIKVRDEALAQLYLLENKRENLNKYQEELHTPCSALNVSVFEVNGRLAKLEHIPDAIFEIPKASQTTIKQLNDVLYLIQQLSKTIEKRTEDYDKNVWKGAIVKYLSNELRHDIDANVTLLANTMQELNSVIEVCDLNLDIKLGHSIAGAEKLLEVLRVAKELPLIPTKWILSADIDDLIAKAKEYRKIISDINHEESYLLDNYDKSIFTIDCATYKKDLSASAAIISQLYKHDKIEELVRHVSHDCSELSKSVSAITSIFPTAYDISAQFGLEKPNTLSKLQHFIAILRVLQTLKDIVPTKKWLDSESFESLSQMVGRCQENHEVITRNSQQIQNNYNAEILELKELSLLKNLEDECNSIFDVIKRENVPFFFEDIDGFSKKLQTAKNTMQLVFDKANQVSKAIGVAPVNNAERLETYITAFSTICSLETITPTSLWLDNSELKKIKQSINEARDQHEELKRKIDSVTNEFDKEILDIDSYPMLQRFRTEYNSIFRIFNPSYKRDIKELKKYSSSDNLNYSSSLHLLAQLKDIADHQSEIDKKTPDYIQCFGEYYKGISTDWTTLENAINEFEKLSLHDILKSMSVRKGLVDGTIPFNEIKEVIETYETSQIDEIYSYLSVLLKRNVAKQESYTRTINSCETAYQRSIVISRLYNESINAVSCYAQSNIKLDQKELSYLYYTLKEIADKREEIELSKDSYLNNFGSYYNGENTNWTILNEYIGRYKCLYALLPKIPSKFKEHLIGGQLPLDSISSFISDYQQANLSSKYDTINSILVDNCNPLIRYKEVIEKCEKAINAAENFLNLYNPLLQASKKKSYAAIISDLDLFATYQRKKDLITRDEANIQNMYASYYAGTNTNWNQLFDALSCAGDLKFLVSEYSLSTTFVKKICVESDAVRFCREAYSQVSECIGKIKEPLGWFTSLFAEDKHFKELDLIDGSNYLTDCKNKKHQLEEWVDYHSIREQCAKNGLISFVNQVETLSISADMIVDTYLKRFYRLWLDEIIPQFPAIRDFRSRNQEQNIREFCTLDVEQFKIAQARVRERLINRIPDFSAITTSRDEIGILKRELNKQRRIMPLRKLFMAIPNLLSTIRPCFMMSPLSVSVFLEAQSYDFDLVVFDEASQVHTEDAIGAIMRGKQVIIVGDTKQLPPTSFFATSLNDEDFDVDDEEDINDSYAGAYESILDESVAILPERSLRWHYRSRDEHLIAFSNIKIYNGSLITFPSSIEKAPDVGVEYVYVADGIYDRGGKKNNMIEAKRVAQLVFEHFRKYPKRSLGVVTFSEAQQNAVDAAIRQMRLNNSAFEMFFADNIEEPFFIKNLENVQGDERDTIIFSIGYAKDSRGVMYMNFGPLSREGGYRRLNVAITRAKYNVKLVGSIHATDIDLEKTSSQGVKLLRSYIEYAQQGISAIENEINYNYDLNFDSPFEEAVYDFLSNKGYEVVTQVGCSGFRIDMAIKHPTQNGKFAIGIECDGATYHSSRTARERDRLRQTVLEDMGWTIYRIWSTDWIKNMKSEEEKLVKAIDAALAGTMVESPIESLLEQIDTSDIYDMEIEEEEEKQEISNSPYGFDYYKWGNNNELIGDSTSEKIKNVIEYHQPIHFEALCKILAPLWGNQKATSAIKRNVITYFNLILKDEIMVKDKYVSLANFDNLRVRIPENINDVRPIDYISEDELALALTTIASQSFGITPDDLIIETARVYGFKRTGGKISSTLRKVYNQLEAEGKICEIDGKVSVVQE